MVLHLSSYIPQDIWQLELIKNIWKSALLKRYILNGISTFPKVAYRLNQNHCLGFCTYLCVLLLFWSYGCLCSVRRTRFLQLGSGCFLIFLLKSFFFFFPLKHLPFNTFSFCILVGKSGRKRTSGGLWSKQNKYCVN